jgi:hypothetical protein
MSYIQSILFDRNKYNLPSSYDWLSEHNIKPLKNAHITKDYIRYRIVEPDNSRKYRTISLTNDIKAVIEF